MAKETLDSVGTFYQHLPKLAVIVTAQDKGKENAMTVDWHTSLSSDPPLYGIRIAPGTFTYQLIAGSKEFAINFLSFEAVALIAQVGSSAGSLMNKFEQFKIAKEEQIKTSVPILKDAYAAYECRLVDDRNYGDHRLLVGEIVALHIRPEAFNRDETLNLTAVSPILYLGREFYLTANSDTLKEIL